MDICLKNDVIIPISIGYEKAQLLTDLINTYGSNGTIVYHYRNKESCLLFENLMKMHIRYVCRKIYGPLEVTGDETIVCISPTTKDHIGVLSNLKVAVSLVIFDDLNIVHDDPECFEVKFLDYIRSSSIICRIVGFTMPLQSTNLTIEHHKVVKYVQKLKDNFNLPVEISFDIRNKHRYVKLDTVRLCQFNDIEDRFRELQIGLDTKLNYDRYVQSMQDLSLFYNEIYDQFNREDWNHLKLDKLKRVPVVMPDTFLKFISHDYYILLEYGEICALKSVEYHFTETFNYIQTLQNNWDLRPYNIFLMKILSQLRHFRNIIHFYLPEDISQKILFHQELSLREYLALSTRRLNCLIEEIVHDYKNSSKNRSKLIVYAPYDTSAKVLSSWMNDLSDIVAKQVQQNNPISNAKSFFYLSIDKGHKIETKFIDEVHYYKKREEELKKFYNSKNSISILFTNSSTLPNEKLEFDRLICLLPIENLYQYVQKKSFLKKNSKFTVICSDKFYTKSCIVVWKNILSEESFYFGVKEECKIDFYSSHIILAEGSIVNSEYREPTPDDNPVLEAWKNPSFNDKKRIDFKVESQLPDVGELVAKSEETFKNSFVYEFVFKKYHPDSPTDTMRKLGFIVREELPQISEFEMAHFHSTYQIAIKKCEINLDLSSEHIKKLYTFNSLIYKRIFSVDVKLDLEKNVYSSKLLLVPLVNDATNLDWKLVDDYIASKFKRFRGPSFKAEHFEDAIICSFMKSEPLYHVTRIDTSKTPRSVVGSRPNLTIATFYEKEYGLTVNDYRQPLLEVSKLVPPYDVMHTFKPTPIFVIPQFYNILSLPFSLWIKITSLPFILNTVFAQIRVHKFNKTIIESLTTQELLPPEDEDRSCLIYFREEVEYNEPIDYDFSEPRNFYDSSLDCNYGKKNVPQESDNDECEKKKDIKEAFSIFMQEMGSNINEIESFDDGSAPIDEDLIDSIEFEANRDQSRSGYKEIADLMNRHQYELIFPQVWYERLLLDSEECKMFLTIRKGNYNYHLNEIARLMVKEENCLVRFLFPDDDESDSKDSGPKPFYDWQQETRITKDTKNISQVIRDVLEPYFVNESIGEEEDVISGNTLIMVFCDFNIQELNKRSIQEYSGRYEEFFGNIVPHIPSAKEILFISGLAFFEENFGTLKEYSLLGKTFIQYILLNATLFSGADSRVITEEMKNLTDEKYFQEMLVDIASKCGLDKIIRLSFNYKIFDWYPTWFISNAQQETQFLTDSVIEEALQALVGLYLNKSGANVAFEMMKNLKFKQLQNFDVNIFDNYNWKNVKIPNDMLVYSLDGLSSKIDKNILHRFIQKEFNYNFKNYNLILQAFTDMSDKNDGIKNLSIIGKNVLDLILGTVVFKAHRESASTSDYYLLSSHAYAQMAAELAMNKFLVYDSPEVFRTVHNFMRTFYCFNQNFDTIWIYDEKEIQKELVEIPTIFFESFQAVFGAIYIDSGFCLKTVYQTFSPFLTQKIEQLRYENPASIVEKFNRVEVSEAVRLKNGDIEFEYSLSPYGKTYGHAKTERLAREYGAKRIISFFSFSESSNDNESNQE